MAGKVSITAFAGSKQKGDVVPIYVSATNDLGIGIAGFTKENFELELLDPVLDSNAQKFFKLGVTKVQDLGKGFYRITCSNSITNSGFLSGPIVLSLRIKKFTGGFGSDSGQTLVSFVLE